MIAFDYYLATHRAAREQVVALVLKALWENADKLPPFHPFFKEWTRERAVDPSVTIPYHPEAIRAYQERGGVESGNEADAETSACVKPVTPENRR